MSYGLHFSWVKDDPTFVKGCEYLILNTSFYPTIFAFITRRRLFSIKPTYEYLLEMNLRDAETGRKLGGFYPTIEEAKRAAGKFMACIFYDPRDYGPQKPNHTVTKE